MKLKKSILLLSLFSFTLSTYAQIVPSSCVASDSILAKYKDDADRLALRKIYQYNLSYVDSIEIPKNHSDSILNALVAVYNATSLPARDTVITLYDIHTYPIPDINSISFSADSNLNWMQQLKNGIVPSGYSPIDSLMIAYHFSIDHYSTWSGILYYHTVYLKSDSNYNLPPLSNVFETVPDVIFSDPLNTCCDGNDIYATIYFDHVELIYSIGWGDCPSGCTERRFWKFNVDYNCSVEYIGSYGDPLPTTGIMNINKRSISVYPNPFIDQLTINTSNELISEVILYDITSRKLLQQKFTNSISLNTSQLAKGIYIYELRNKNGVIKKGKVVKD